MTVHLNWCCWIAGVNQTKTNKQKLECQLVTCHLPTWWLAVASPCYQHLCHREVKKSPVHVKVWATQTVPYKFNHAKVKKDLKKFFCTCFHGPLFWLWAPVQCTACTPLSMALISITVNSTCHIYLASRHHLSVKQCRQLFSKRACVALSFTLNLHRIWWLYRGKIGSWR